MFSPMSEIEKDLKKMDPTVSTLGRLLGILFYAIEFDSWIAYNEVCLDQWKWFSNYSQAWKEILKRSDEELGFALEGGKDGEYRSVLLKMIGRWQKDTNQLLDDLYHAEWGYGFNVKVDIVEVEGEEDYDHSSSDAESNASSEDGKETGSEKRSSGSKQAAVEGTSSQRQERGKG